MTPSLSFQVPLHRSSPLNSFGKNFLEVQVELKVLSEFMVKVSMRSSS